MTNQTQFRNALKFYNVTSFNLLILFVYRHFYLSWAEIESFLKHLSNCAQNSGSSATVTEIKRCVYVLQVKIKFRLNFFDRD